MAPSVIDEIPEVLPAEPGADAGRRHRQGPAAIALLINPLPLKYPPSRSPRTTFEMVLRLGFQIGFLLLETLLLLASSMSHSVSQGSLLIHWRT